MPLRRHLIATLLLLAGFALRLIALDRQPLWWDEGYSLFFATETPARLLSLTSYDIHPPLYYLLLQGWLAIVGIGSGQARLFSVMCGMLSLPLAWWIARHLLGKATAWVTLILLVISPMAIYYAQEVRMYALVMLLALAAIAAWLHRRWLWLGVAVAAGCLTHYYVVLLALALALLVLLDLRARRYPLAGPRRALAVTLVGVIPWLLYAAPRLLRYVGGKLQIEADRPMTPLEFLPRHLAAWSVGHPSVGWGWLGWASLLFVVLAVIALLRGWYRRRDRPGTLHALGTLALLWLVPTVATFLIGLRAPFVDARIERQLLMVQPLFLILVARGVIVLWRRWSVAVGSVVALLVVTSLAALYPFYTLPRYPGEDYRPLLAQVGPQQVPGDGWVAVYPWQVGYLRAYLPHRHPTPIEVPTAWADDAAQRERGIAALYAQHPRLWLPAYQIKGRLFEAQLADTLTGEGVPARDDWFGNTRLYLFGRAPTLPPLAPIGRFDGAGEAQAALGSSEVASGSGILPLFLRVEQPSPDVRASVQVVGLGSVWGEWDGALQGEITRIGLPVDVGTPPGSYSVRLTLYRQASGTPLDRFVGAQRDSPDAEIGPVQVTRPETLSPLAVRDASSEWFDLLLGGRLRLLGAALPEQQAWQQGDRLPLTLFWQSVGALGDLRLFVQALDAQGVPRAARDLPPVNGTFPTTVWQPGDLVRDPHLLPLPADMPPGAYQLVVGAYDPATGARLAAPDGRDAIPLGTIHVSERARTMQEPTVGTALDPPLQGGRADLLRVALPPMPEAGQPLDVILVWRSTTLAPTGAAPLRSFAQLFVGDQQVPVSDHLFDPPSTAWIEGEWITDSHRLLVPGNLPPGEARLLVGLYDSETGERLGEQVIATWMIR